MKKFPLFASLDPSFFSSNSRVGNVHLLRNKILQSDVLLKYSHWTRKNFLGSLARGKIPYKNKYFCTICISVEYKLKDIYVHLGTGEKLLLSEIINSVINGKYPLGFIFIYCSRQDHLAIESAVKGYDYKNFSVYISSNDERRFLFALACEMVNWWELKSSKDNDVSFRHISNCVQSTIQNYKEYSPDGCFDFSHIDLLSRVEGIAWNQGNNYCIGTDIDKLFNGSREEQVADTIKRIFDNANHPREEHFTSNERLISSQGLFWLSEISYVNDVKNWILFTRFYTDISGEMYDEAIQTNIRRKKHIDEKYLSNMLKYFVKVNHGIYEFGINNDVESEPPANICQASLSEFLILKFPVTQDFWSQIVDDATQPSELPKVDITYFEALDFAKLLNEIFKEYFPEKFSAFRVNLPNEYQWEAAARGPRGFNYPWGNSFKINYCNCEMTVGKPTKVGQYSPHGDSFFGCQDMSGNVREWTRSYGGTKGFDWQSHSPEIAKEKNFTLLLSSRMIVKGGSYSYSYDCVTCWMRNTQIASRKDGQTGFRLVIEKIGHNE